MQDLIRKNPDHPHAHYTLGEVYQAQKPDAEAEAAFRDAIQVNAKWQLPYIGLINLCVERKDYNSALEILNLGLRNPPDDPLLRFLLAQTLEQGGEVDRAVAEYESILKSDLGMDMAANKPASLLTDQRSGKTRLERAVALAQRFENSVNPTFRDTLGCSLVRAGRVVRGRQILRQVADERPDVPICQCHLRMAHKLSGDKTQAKIHPREALAGSADFPGNREARTTRAEL